MQKFLSVLLVLFVVTEFFYISARHTPPNKGTPKPKGTTTTPSANATTEEIENDPAPKWCDHEWCDWDCECGYRNCKTCKCKECW